MNASRGPEAGVPIPSRTKGVDHLIDKSGDCWVWTGAKLHSNTAPPYGRIYIGQGAFLAHRYVYELHRGPIPAGATLDHLCRNRLCVKPDHLEPVTTAENTHRSPIAPAAINARKTHCIRGHEFTAANTLHQPSGRACRECVRATKRAYKQRLREAA